MIPGFQKAGYVCAALLALQLGCSKEPLPQANESAELKIVAHYDDDLLFMSPDLAESIQEGRPVRTVFLTAGDAGKDVLYWRGREEGILEAYAAMAGVPNSWHKGEIIVSDRQVELQTLAGSSHVSLVLLRLPDGNGHGHGFPATGSESLAKLWSGKIPSMHPVDGSRSYSRSELVEVLVDLMEDFLPKTVDTQDWTPHFKRDHSDHVHAGLFAHAAEQRYSASHESRVYRGYNSVDEPVNLLASQQAAKERFLVGYARHDAQLCAPRAGSCRPYSHFLGRQYPFIPGTLVGPGGKCLQVEGSVGAETRRARASLTAAQAAARPPAGEQVALRPCRDVNAQKWSMVGRQIKNGQRGCLSVEQPDSSSPWVVLMQACDGSSHQSWSISKDGHLKGADGSCVMLAPLGAKRGTELLLGDCGDVPEQGWRLYGG